jgi:hypothetical protein
VKTLMTERALQTAATGPGWNDLYGHGLGNACRALGLETCTHPIEITPPEPFELAATGSRVKGFQQAELAWTGAGSAQVDVYRDGVLVATTANDGAHVDAIGLKGKGAYAYQVCEAGTSTCSNPVAVAF